MPTESKETKTTPEKAETLEQRIERLEKENAELRAENEKLKSKSDQGSLKEEIVVNRLYRFGKSKLDKVEINNILENLNGEYKNKIEDFIKNDKIEDLQKYLNGLIDSGAINKDQIVNNCMERGIWLRNGHILEDGKFGPQTFEAIKCLSSASGGGKGGKEKEYIESTVRDKKIRIYKISSVDELPDGYKWEDPENYNINNKDTYPKVYVLSVDNVKYTFYSNGRCYNSTEKKKYNTKDIVEKLKKLKGVGQSENHDEGENIPDIERYQDRDAILNRIEKSKDDFKIKDLFGNEYTFHAHLGTSTVNKQNIQFEIRGKNGDMSGGLIIASFELKCGKFLDKNGRFDESNWENVILPNIKANLKSQIDAYAKGKECVKYLTTHYWTQKDLFPEITEDDISKYNQLSRYFRTFDGKFEFDSTSTKYKDGKIYLQIDNKSFNKSYHKAENNPALIVNLEDLCDASGKYKLAKANRKIKSIIEGIIEKYNI